MKPVLPHLFTLLLAACAPMEPGAPAVAPLDAPTLQLSAATTVSWPDARWWSRYQDPQLDSLIGEALRASPSLQTATAQLAQARAAARGARAVQWPQINANYHLNRERYSETYQYPPPLGGSYQTDTGLQLQLNFDPDLWGGLHARALGAQQRAQAAQASRQQARVLLVSAVAQTYFQLQGAQAQAQAIEAIVGQLQAVLDITRERYRNGLGIRVDVDQADSAVASARVQLSQARNNVTLLHHQLAVLVGQSPEQLPAIIPRTAIRLPPPAPARLPMALLGRRADIVAARLQAEAAGAEVSAAKADFLPNINLSASAGFLSLGVDTLFRSASRDYGVGPVVTLPLFNAGALNAQLAGRRAERDQAIAQYNMTVLDALRDVASVTASRLALAEQIRHQEASLNAIASAYDVARDRYRVGIGDFVQVLQAQSETLKQTIQSTDLHAQAYVLDVRLASALGGGYGDDDRAVRPDAPQSKN